MSIYKIPTFTGITFDLGEPTADMICIEDIAHHLSIENRYGGATKFAYSVAYHSLLVCSKAPNNIKLEALLHDAAEAYTKDLLSPYIKLSRDNNDVTYDELTNEVDRLIMEKFNLIDAHPAIKKIDLRLATTEILQLIKYFSEKDWQHDHKESAPYNDIFIMQLSPQNVEKLFLAEFEKWRRN